MSWRAPEDYVVDDTCDPTCASENPWDSGKWRIIMFTVLTAMHNRMKLENRSLSATWQESH